VSVILFGLRFRDLIWFLDEIGINLAMIQEKDFGIVFSCIEMVLVVAFEFNFWISQILLDVTVFSILFLGLIENLR